MLAQRENVHIEPRSLPAVPLARRSEILRRALCAGLIVLGVLVGIGWLFDVGQLKSVIPGLSTMKFNTAAEFVLSGAGLWLAGQDQRLARYTSAAIGIIVIAVGALTAIEYASGGNLGIDQLVVVDSGTLTGSGHPGRMSVLTAG